ncbi:MULTISPECIES: sensor histidine kinase [Aliarcobacter]|uniref:histidine kinase n=2 Tax=unclassified Arcobacter TaxID=2593671 RepID=A0AA96CP76_9BACT|nr:HAMP domain-containing sensor histidine kinase [Aliarcobacter cryaerophilus]WNL13340.1 HAMP domain-containing sensor histidine kinase [Arcobacter sp. AZ-2023]WPD09825.1 HAMP domain-containing sensor histidine kinase [Arcobacter sp. DSM 115954]AYJ78031.1 two-component system sensor histidine kinase [Aliarcobacter cryaerophilus D2610]MCT7470827.1 HAMP domain-containing histidine kinase [Aliarcobacter cryaerophilus]MCT7485243.1 HAMP domain-containing histidine kinase [Aliarcobacter cryaerophil
MLVLKSSGIDLSKSETRTIIGFSLIYSILVLVILGVITFLYYQFKKDLMLQDVRQTLQNYSNTQIANLKELHINIDKSDIYPRDERFNSAIYDSSKKKIFSTLLMGDVKLDEVIYLKDGYIHLIKEPESYYLGSKYVIVEIEDDNIWFANIKYKMLFWFLFSFILLLFVGYFIAKLFLKPMRESIQMLDRFIKDTTHELNTPIAAILSNIQMINKDNIDEKLAKKINRIEIGAKTISNIYEDLTFVSLNNQIISNNEKLNFSQILNQRVDFFKSIANSKQIEFILDIKENVFIVCDIKKLSKLIDNILSNAIKYNKFQGFIKVTLKDKILIIEDSGKGMSKDNLANLFTRYKRFDKSVGGFGIGLNIVSLIAKEYDLKIDVISKIDVGTRIKIRWQD